MAMSPQNSLKSRSIQRNEVKHITITLVCVLVDNLADQDH